LTGAGTTGCDGAQAGNRRPRVIKTNNTISEGLKVLMINPQNDNYTTCVMRIISGYFFTLVQNRFRVNVVEKRLSEVV
jgi:hypothetical protein